MFICQHNADLQPSTDSPQDIDWTQATQSYPSMEEAPSYYSSDKQLDNKSSTPQLILSVCRGSNCKCTSPCSNTTVQSVHHLTDCFRHSWYREVIPRPLPQTSPPTGVAAFNVNGHTLHSFLSRPTGGDFKDLEGERLSGSHFLLSRMSSLMRCPW